MLKMRYLILPLTLVLFSINVFAVTVLEGDALSPPQRLQSRKLSAASRHSIIQARSDSFTLSNEVEVTYADGCRLALAFCSILIEGQGVPMESAFRQLRPLFASRRPNRSLFLKISSIYCTA